MHPLVFKMLPKHNNPNPNRGSLTFQSYISFSSHAGVARCRFVIYVATLLLWAHTTVPTPLTIEDLCISNVFFILLSTMLTRVFLFSFFLIWVFWTTHPRVRGPFSLSFAFVFPDNNKQQHSTTTPTPRNNNVSLLQINRNNLRPTITNCMKWLWVWYFVIMILF